MDKTLEIELARIRPKVLALAKKFLKASKMVDDPEDIVQDVLLRLWKTSQEGTQIRNAEAWAISITKNSCISLWRKKRGERSQLLPEWLPDGNDASMRVEQCEAQIIVGKAFDRPPSATRRLLQLKATGLSLDEIAIVTGRPKGSIKSSISAARKEMIKSLNIK